jgi:hypothetical protein
VKLWFELHDYYLSDVPGCTYAAAANALRMAAQEFCEQTQVWRVTLADVTTLANTPAYNFPVTAEQEVCKLLEAKLGEQRLPLLLHDQLGNNQIGICNVDQRQFQLQPTPAAGLKVSIKAVLKPSNIATGIDDLLYSFHARAIAQGAKAELFAMVNQPFSNPGAAEQARDRFENMMAIAKINAAKGYSSAPLRTQPSFM